MEIKSNSESLNFGMKFIYCLAGIIGIPFLITLSSLAFINVNKLDNSKEIELLTSILTITYTATPILILLSVLFWHFFKKNETTKIKYYCITSCRYILATILIFYGFSKLIGEGQFHIGFLSYGEEIGSINSTSLAWSFFSFSKYYNATIALTEIIGGTLLLFRRTTLLGSLFLLPVLINIAIIDFCFDINAKDIISALLFMNIFLLSISLKPLASVFIFQKSIDPKILIQNYGQKTKTNKLVKLFSILFVFFFGFIINFNQIKKSNPNVLQGAWKATLVKNLSDTIPEKNKLLRLKLFIDGDIATIKKTYQFEDFQITNDSKNFGKIVLNSYDTLNKNKIIGNYKLVNNDSLIISGKEGNDSIYWIFKRYSR